jgi:hypothetical protein
MRRFGLLFLLLSLFWQSVVFAGSLWVPERMEDRAHAALHWEQEAHHHHDDGSYHVEDSSEALAHVQFDGALQLTALLGGTLCPPALPTGSAPADTCELHLPAPPPDGLRRPPRLQA